LVACPYFALVKWSGFAGPARLETGGRFRVVTAVSGSLILSPESGDRLCLALGETVLVPASLASVTLKPESPDAEAIVSFVPELDIDVRTPLRAAGHSDAAIARLSGPPGV